MMYEIIRILKKKSKLILIQPNYRLCTSNYFDDYTHRTILSDVSLRDYLKSKGFRINYVNPSYLPFSMQGILPKTYFLTNDKDFYFLNWEFLFLISLKILVNIIFESPNIFTENIS